MMLRDRTRFSFGFGALFAALGLTSAPSKVTIRHEISRARSYTGKIVVPFNPSTLSTQSSVSWETVNLAATSQQRMYALQYTGSSATPGTLAFDLNIDAHEGDPSAGGGWGSLISLPNPTAMHVFTAPSGVSVLPYIDPIMRLQTIAPELHRPPLCEVWWGQIRLIEGPLTSLTQKITRFLADGTPVRAQLSLTFTDASLSDAGELFSNDVQKTHTVKLGDTIQAIAAHEYGDPGQWRRIAEANDLDDPRVLLPGAVLVIPAVR